MDRHFFVEHFLGGPVERSQGDFYRNLFVLDCSEQYLGKSALAEWAPKVVFIRDRRARFQHGWDGDWGKKEIPKLRCADSLSTDVPDRSLLYNFNCSLSPSLFHLGS